MKHLIFDEFHTVFQSCPTRTIQFKSNCDERQGFAHNLLCTSTVYNRWRWQRANRTHAKLFLEFFLYFSCACRPPTRTSVIFKTSLLRSRWGVKNTVSGFVRCSNFSLPDSSLHLPVRLSRCEAVQTGFSCLPVTDLTKTVVGLVASAERELVVSMLRTIAGRTIPLLLPKNCRVFFFFLSNLVQAEDSFMPRVWPREREHFCDWKSVTAVIVLLLEFRSHRRLFLHALGLSTHTTRSSRSGGNVVTACRSDELPGFTPTHQQTTV